MFNIIKCPNQKVRILIMNRVAKCNDVDTRSTMERSTYFNHDCMEFSSSAWLQNVLQ